MNRLCFWSPSESHTLRFGEVLGQALAPPVWIGLVGPLGAGKTRLAQSLAKGLGYTGRVRSPSYVLEHRYPGPVPIRHLDLYRLETAAEDLEASWADEDEDVVLVEWAERAVEVPENAHWIRLDPVGETERWIEFSWPRRGGRLRAFRLETLLRAKAGPPTEVSA